MRAIYIYTEYIKVATNYCNIRLLVTISFIGYYFRNNLIDSYNQSHIKKTYKTISNDILYTI